MARKREERAAHSSKRAARRERQSNGQDQNFVSLKQQLVAMGLTLREIPGDGNCLFRALGDQLDGTTTNHHKHRHQVVDYMRQHREDFEPFVEDDVPFDRHCNNLAQLGTYAGNDCIVAFARLHQVSVVIHQLNTPCWQINGTESKKGVMELHISYHNGDHYNSVRRLGDYTSGPARIKMSTTTLSSAATAAAAAAVPKASMKGLEDDDYDDDDEEGIREDGIECHLLHLSSMSNGHHGVSQMEQELMEQTGCEDLGLVQKYLCAHDYQVREAADALINYIVHQHKGEYPQTSPSCSNGQLCSPEGITSGPVVGGMGVPRMPPVYRKMTQQEKLHHRLQTQQHLSNSKRKELKKQLRKQEANERKRQRQTGQEYDDYGADESEVILVKDIGCLSI